MNRFFSVTSTNHPEVGLRTITASDQENLRNWKNAHRNSFFFKELITPVSQQNWFTDYLTRDQDYMFLITANGEEIGCMGFRLRNTTWDIYNVIRGTHAVSRSGHMGQALHMMCSYAISLQPLRVAAEVINTNPALGWYCRNGFRISKVHATYTEIELDSRVFVPCSAIELVEIAPSNS